jgi:hypothetical protein
MIPFHFIDQHGCEVPITIKQDGGLPGWVKPGRRTRFKIRPQTIALRIERIEFGHDPKDWLVNDFRIGDRSQFPTYGGTAKRSIHNEDTPEQDGIDGETLCTLGSAIRSDNPFDTVQTAMDIIFDVVYRGPNPEGQPMDCTIHCTAAQSSSAPVPLIV